MAMEPDSERYLPLADAAEILGVSYEWLRQWTSGKQNPTMPHKRWNRRTLVRASVASSHLQKYARRLPSDFRPYHGGPAVERAPEDCVQGEKGSGGPCFMRKVKNLQTRVRLESEEDFSYECKYVVASLQEELPFAEKAELAGEIADSLFPSEVQVEVKIMPGEIRAWVSPGKDGQVTVQAVE